MPLAAPSTTVPCCPHCDAELLPGAMRCWLCEAEVQPAAAHGGAAPPAAGQPVPPERVGTYSLASLMMFVTLVCVVLGVSMIAPGIGIPLGIIALLATVRTAVLVRRQMTLGHQPNAAERAILFAASLGVVIVAGIAAAVAFSAMCFGGLFAGLGAARPEDYGSALAGAVFGGIIGAPLAAWVFYRIMKAFSSKATNKP